MEREDLCINRREKNVDVLLNWKANLITVKATLSCNKISQVDTLAYIFRILIFLVRLPTWEV
jgi:hypothetical protein